MCTRKPVFLRRLCPRDRALLLAAYGSNNSNNAHSVGERSTHKGMEASRFTSSYGGGTIADSSSPAAGHLR